MPLTPKEWKQIEKYVKAGCTKEELLEFLETYVGEQTPAVLPRVVAPFDQHQAEIDKARGEFRGGKRKLEPLPEVEGSKLVELADEPGTMVEVPADMPEGAFTNVAGKVRTLKDGKLHVAVKEEAAAGSIILP